MNDSAVMITPPDQLYVERIAPEKNMARFMHLLFSRLCSARYLLRAWGRIGTRGRQMLHLFDNESWAVLLFLDVLREKLMRGISQTNCGNFQQLTGEPAVNNDKSVLS